MDYILNIASWYPTTVNNFTGDFVQRHAHAIAQYEKIIVFTIIKNKKVNKVTIEKNISNNIEEIIVYYPEKKYFSNLFSLWFYCCYGIKTINEILKVNGKPKLIHLNVVHKGGIFALWFKIIKKINYVITEHWSGYLPQAPHNIFKSFGLKKYLHKQVYKHSLLHIPVTKNLGEILEHWQPKYKVIHNVVNTNLFNYKVKSNISPEITHISNMTPEKNFEAIFKTITSLLKQDYKFIFKIIGPIDAAYIIEINKDQLLKKNILYTGNISYTDVAEQLAQSDLLIMYSKYESMPCVILEALCCGVPVITSNVGGISEVINESNGILINADNDIVFENTIKGFLNNEYNFNNEEIARNAKSKFSFEFIGKQYQAIFNKLINGR